VSPRRTVSGRLVCYGAILSSMIASGSGCTSCLWRHGRSMIRPARGLSRDHAVSAELSRTCCGSYCRSSMVVRCEQRPILTCGMLMLHLRGYRRMMRFMGVMFLFRCWARAHPTVAAVECHVRIVVYDDGAIYIHIGDAG
jgi:hypothetical protein